MKRIKKFRHRSENDRQEHEAAESRRKDRANIQVGLRQRDILFESEMEDIEEVRHEGWSEA